MQVGLLLTSQQRNIWTGSMEISPSFRISHFDIQRRFPPVSFLFCDVQRNREWCFIFAYTWIYSARSEAILILLTSRIWGLRAVDCGNIRVGLDTLRNWMTGWQLWRPFCRRCGQVQSFEATSSYWFIFGGLREGTASKLVSTAISWFEKG